MHTQKAERGFDMKRAIAFGVSSFVAGFVLGVALFGCGPTVEIEPTNPVDVPDAGNDAIDDKPDAYVDSGPMLLPDGAECDESVQCESNYCVPSKTPFRFGICFSANSCCCIEVTEPSPFKASCSGPTEHLYTCGDAYDVSTLGQCEIVGVGKLLEYYHCCPEMP
jgi:hypothetical protein